MTNESGVIIHREITQVLRLADCCALISRSHFFMHFRFLPSGEPHALYKARLGESPSARNSSYRRSLKLFCQLFPRLFTSVIPLFTDPLPPNLKTKRLATNLVQPS